MFDAQCSILERWSMLNQFTFHSFQLTRNNIFVRFFFVLPFFHLYTFSSSLYHPFLLRLLVLFQSVEVPLPSFYMTIFISKRYIFLSQWTGWCKRMFGLCVCVQCSVFRSKNICRGNKQQEVKQKKGKIVFCATIDLSVLLKILQHFFLNFVRNFLSISLKLEYWLGCTVLRDSRNEETNVSIYLAFRCTAILSAKANYTIWKFACEQKTAQFHQFSYV